MEKPRLQQDPGVMIGMLGEAACMGAHGAAHRTLAGQATDMIDAPTAENEPQAAVRGRCGQVLDGSDRLHPPATLL